MYIDIHLHTDGWMDISHGAELRFSGPRERGLQHRGSGPRAAERLGARLAPWRRPGDALGSVRWVRAGSGGGFRPMAGEKRETWWVLAGCWGFEDELWMILGAGRLGVNQS